MRTAGAGPSLVVLVAAIVGLGAQSVLAAEESPTYINGATRKLGRGIANLATAPVEMMRQTTLIGERDGGLAALTVGMIRGVVWTAWRAVGGAFEVVTFPVPIPRDFQPLVKPEFVFVHGQWSP